MICKFYTFSAAMSIVCTSLFAAANKSSLQLHTRSREANKNSAEQSKEVLKTVSWNPNKTASLSLTCGMIIGAKVLRSEWQSWPDR